MKDIIKIAIIGCTGKSGKYLVKELLNEGFYLKLLLRNPKDFKTESPLIKIIEGDVRNYSSVKLLLQDCDAIISTLGQPKGESPIFSQATKNVIKAMGEYGIKRYVLITGLNVDTPFDEKSTKTKFSTDWMKTNYPETTTDKQLEYSLLTESTIQWTLVRLPLIEQTAKRGELLVSLTDCPGDKISATDLANFLIRQLTDDSYLNKSPFIATA